MLVSALATMEGTEKQLNRQQVDRQRAAHLKRLDIQRWLNGVVYGARQKKDITLKHRLFPRLLSYLFSSLPWESLKIVLLGSCARQPGSGTRLSQLGE
jgi:hypothetical protein